MIADNLPQERTGDLHGSALVVGALAGAVVAAIVAGSVIFVIVLAFGAIVGAVLAALAALALDRLRGRNEPSGDHPVPTLSADGGPAAQRSEAGHTSPSST